MLESMRHHVYQQNTSNDDVLYSRTRPISVLTLITSYQFSKIKFIFYDNSWYLLYEKVQEFWNFCVDPFLLWKVLLIWKYICYEFLRLLGAHFLPYKEKSFIMKSKVPWWILYEWKCQDRGLNWYVSLIPCL